MPALSKDDLVPKSISLETLKALEKNPLDGAATLDAFQWLLSGYESSYQWYMNRRVRYRRWASVCRFVGITGFVSTILWPAFQLVGAVEYLAKFLQMEPDKASQLGYLLAVAGGASMTVDKMAGFSATWLRNGGTAMKLMQTQEILQVRWASVVRDNGRMDISPVHPPQGEQPGGAKTPAAASESEFPQNLAYQRIAILREGAATLWHLINTEISDWSKSYVADLKQLEDNLSKISAKK